MKDKDTPFQQHSENSTAYHDAMLRELLDSIPDMAFFKDAEGRYRISNKAFEIYVGKSKADILGKNDHELFSDLSDDSDFYNEMDARAIASGGPSSNEEDVTYPDGSHRTLETIKTPVFAPDGTLRGLMGLARDITARKLDEEILKKARREAEQASRAKSEFLANMSHEIRTPMNGILGLCHLARQQECPPELDSYLYHIEASARRLMGVLNDILDFSKVEAGKLEIEKREFSLRELAAHVLMLLRLQSRDSGVDVSCELAPDLMEHVLGDALRIQQIMLNLGSNAVKFTTSGAVLLSLSLLKVESGVASIEIAVADTGIGIAPDTLPRLFRPFSQADSSTTRRYGGTGLGLSICASFTALMGGTLSVESAPGKGSLFVVTLPLELPPELASKVESRQPEKQSLEALRGARVLLAEDNAINQMITSEMLAAQGVTVDIADDGSQALDLAAKKAYDAILMDIQMPVMGGIESAARLRANRAMDNVPILALSACVLDDERKASAGAGMQAHVTKPVDPEQLCAVLALWIERARSGERWGMPTA